MPKTKVVFFRGEDGKVPFLDWLDQQPEKAQDKCVVRLDLLRGMGHELRRPHADFLRDGIYELRVDLQGVHYRILYFYHGNIAIVVSHGVVKSQTVPGAEIDLVLRRKGMFARNPERHTYEEDL